MRTVACNSARETPIARGTKVSVLSLLLSTVLAVSAYSQQAPAPAQPATGVITIQELAKSAHNPLEDFINFQFNPRQDLSLVSTITPAIALTSSRWCRSR
jgi:hypothetical protein